MKALLIIIFAAYVTTTVALRGVVVEDDDSDELFIHDEGDDDMQPLLQCSERTKGSFSLYDYSVVLAMLSVSLKIGVFYGYFHKSSSHSADSPGSSKMGLFPVTLSLATSFVTAIELLGNPAEMYFYGTQFALIGESLHSVRRCEKEEE